MSDTHKTTRKPHNKSPQRKMDRISLQEENLMKVISQDSRLTLTLQLRKNANKQTAMKKS